MAIRSILACNCSLVRLKCRESHDAIFRSRSGQKKCPLTFFQCQFFWGTKASNSFPEKMNWGYNPRLSLSLGKSFTWQLYVVPTKGGESAFDHKNSLLLLFLHGGPSQPTHPSSAKLWHTKQIRPLPPPPPPPTEFPRKKTPGKGGDLVGPSRTRNCVTLFLFTRGERAIFVSSAIVHTISCMRKTLQLPSRERRKYGGGALTFLSPAFLRKCKKWICSF